MRYFAQRAARRELDQYCEKAEKQAELGHPESIEVDIERARVVGRNSGVDVSDYVNKMTESAGVAHFKAAERAAESAFSRCKEIEKIEKPVEGEAPKEEAPKEKVRVARVGAIGQMYVDSHGLRYLNDDGKFKPMGIYREDDLNVGLLSEAQEIAIVGYDESAFRTAKKHIAKSNLSAEEKTDFNRRLHQRVLGIKEDPTIWLRDIEIYTPGPDTGADRNDIKAIMPPDFDLSRRLAELFGDGGLGVNMLYNAGPDRLGPDVVRDLRACLSKGKPEGGE